MPVATEPRMLANPADLGGGHRFHAMVKPVGSTCNLDCTYCYYLHKESLLQQNGSRRMADDLLEQHIRQYIEAQDGDSVLFTWHGGEPTLLGLEYFERIVALQAKHASPGRRIDNDLQTNGTLLDDDWARFLKRHGFLVGLSIDGPRDLHDRYRVTKGGKATFGEVMRAAELLHRHEVPFNALCVINRENAKQPREVYRFLVDKVRPREIQFIPCVEPKDFESQAPTRWNPVTRPKVGSAAARPGTPDSIVTDWSVDPDDWGTFLSAVWDEWLARDFGDAFVDIFESTIAQSMGLPAQRCVSAEFCGKALAIERNGDVFSCDHFVYPEFRLGNIKERHLGDMAFSYQQRRFGFEKRNSLPQYCLDCDHLNLCWGDCPKNRFLQTPDGVAGLSYLCSGLKAFFSHAKKDLPDIASRIAANR